MSQEIPIDVTTTFMESSRVKLDIIATMTDVCYLTGLSFVNSNGDKAKTLTPHRLSIGKPVLIILNLLI